MSSKAKKYFDQFQKCIGPGIITGVSDDDPSGIATYSQAGAQFGFGVLWIMVFTLPLMIAIQEISGRLGQVTGEGIAANIRRHSSKAFLYPLVFILLVVNTLNIGADIQVMGSAMEILVGGSALLYCLIFALITLGLEIFVPYSRYVNWLKWLTLVLFSYVATAFAVHIPWLEVLKSLVIPQVKLNTDFFKMFLAILGTTISPYLFFWQASEECEDLYQCKEMPLLKNPSRAVSQLIRIKVDTYVGMTLSNIGAFFIMLTTAVTLHAHGLTHLNTAAEAAEALRPLAGKFCFLLFSLGLIGTGLLAVPVLAGSAAYAVGEAFGWEVGLEKKLKEAKGFYAILAASTLVGLAFTLLRINPIEALIWTSVLNGVISAPIMAMILWLASKESVMGPYTIKPVLKTVGWIATLVMLLASLGLFFTGV
jgi:NRAMP (natural resistance-associated macrophage protein)-like metal ion transporter